MRRCESDAPAHLRFWNWFLDSLKGPKRKRSEPQLYDRAYIYVNGVLLEERPATEETLK